GRSPCPSGIPASALGRCRPATRSRSWFPAYRVRRGGQETSAAPSRCRLASGRAIFCPAGSGVTLGLARFLPEPGLLGDQEEVPVPPQLVSRGRVPCEDGDDLPLDGDEALRPVNLAGHGCPFCARRDRAIVSGVGPGRED